MINSIQLPNFRRLITISSLNMASRVPAIIVSENIIIILGICILSLYVSAPYVNLDPTVNPSGREYLSEIDSHQFWVNLWECGACSLWNGTYRGGYPGTLAFDAFLHPLNMVLTLLFGVVNGSKISVPIALVVGGLGQWWLCKELQLSRITTVWTVSIAIVGGHLLGRMENGALTLLFMTACSSLFFPAMLRLISTPNLRNSVILSLVFANLIYGGIGYPQICVGLLTASLWLVALKISPRPTEFSKYLIIASVMACLLGGPVLIPLVHFGNNFAKEVFTDFRGNQPLYVLFLNFVIDSADYYKSSFQGKLPYPYLYINYIGWTPLLAAVYYVLNTKRRSSNIFFAVATTSCLVIVYASTGELFRNIADAKIGSWLTNFAMGIRSPTLMQSIMITPILGMAALGVDSLLDQEGRHSP